ncbi:MAG: sulfate adenylyltransferase subunit 1, partial [Panacagrimonas sp.]
MLRFVTAGSVDDGKSTLIGRLLYDSRAIQQDQLDAMERASLRRGATDIDLSLLTDGLEAEREQGITIDVAYRYFATPRRKFIIADAPGHEQYTRNMATGASTADAAVLLVDVRKQLVEQTRRHLLLARLLGVRHAIAFVNKLDLVGFSQGIFEGVRESIQTFAVPLGFDTLEVLPGSALRGDMVVARGSDLGWFEGPTLLERLESLETAVDEAAAGPLRLAVQLVSRPQGDAARAYLGRIDSGVLAVGAEVLVLPAGRCTRVRTIVVQGAPSEAAAAGDSVSVTLADDIDIGRGDLIVDVATPPREARALEATLVWFDAEPLRPSSRYLVQQGSRRTLARVREVTGRRDVHTLEERAADGPISTND